MFLWEYWIIQGVWMIITPKTKVYMSKAFEYTDVQVLPLPRKRLRDWNLPSPGIIRTSYSGNSVPTFRENLSVPPPKGRERISWPLKLEPIDYPETSVRNYHHTLRNIPEEHGNPLLLDGSLISLKDCSFFSENLSNWSRDAPSGQTEGRKWRR